MTVALESAPYIDNTDEWSPWQATVATTAAARTTATHAISHRPLSSHPGLRRMTTHAVAWRAALGPGRIVALGDLDSARSARPDDALRARMRLADEGAWDTAGHWCSIELQFSGSRGVPVRLAAHAQWDELAEPNHAQLPVALRHAIAAHVTSGLRRCIGRCMWTLGIQLQDAAVALHIPTAHAGADDKAGAASARGPVLELAVAAQPSTTQWLVLIPIADMPLPASAGPLQRVPGDTRCNPWVPVRAVLGRQRLSRDQLAALTVGDVVLLADVPAQLDGQRTAWLMAGDTLLGAWQTDDAAHRSLAGHLPSGSRVGRWHPAASPPSLDTRSALLENDSSSTGTSALQQLSLSAEVTIDALPQRFNDVQLWGAGTVVGLAASVDSDQLQLRVNGQTTARGRLVAIGDMLGFEIVELFV